MYLLKVLNTTRIVKKTKINDSRLVRQISGGILDKFWRTDMKDKPLYPLLYPSLHHRTKGTVYGISSYPPLIECLFRFTTIPFKPFAQQNDKDLCVFCLIIYNCDLRIYKETSRIQHVTLISLVVPFIPLLTCVRI